MMPLILALTLYATPAAEPCADCTIQVADLSMGLGLWLSRLVHGGSPTPPPGIVNISFDQSDPNHSLNMAL